jgi:MFS transporter, OFA family, oxalate/formate antiporter
LLGRARQADNGYFSDGLASLARIAKRTTALHHLQSSLARRLPFFYGWVVLACAACAGFARQGPAVATLTVFMVPMTNEFGWSTTEMSGAVALGGIMAAISSPMLGPLVDRHGARAMLCSAVLITGVAALLLSQTSSLLMFYLFFCVARMNFAGPFDLGIYGAVNSWFIRRRPIANSMVTVALMVGLTSMPLIAHFAMEGGGWRAGWVAVGVTVLLVGFLPTFLLMARRPEDLDLKPDGDIDGPGDAGSAGAVEEPIYTRAQAMRTRAFWVLLAFTALAYPVQAGVSLHQAPLLLERGLDPTVAATVVSLFSAVTGISGFLYGLVTRRLGMRVTLSFAGLAMAAGCGMMIGVENAFDAYLAAVVFGLGLGGLLTIPPLAWADYFGRKSFGAIRGVALSAQVTAQACGPMISAVLRDWTGDYVLSLQVFAAISLVAASIIWIARPPSR